MPPDTEEDQLRKSVLVLSSGLMATLAFAWVGTYAVPSALRRSRRVLQCFVRARERALDDLAIERGRSERLLLNVLPPPAIDRRA